MDSQMAGLRQGCIDYRQRGFADINPNTIPADNRDMYISSMSV